MCVNGLVFYWEMQNISRRYQCVGVGVCVWVCVSVCLFLSV